MRPSAMRMQGAVSARKLLKLVNGDIAALMLRQMVVAALFFLSNIVLMARVRGSEFAAFVDAQNTAYLLIAAVIGGLQPTLMYFTIKSGRNVRAVLGLSMAVAGAGAAAIVAVCYGLALRGGPTFPLATLLALSLMASSTFPFFLLAVGRISLFAALEIIPNAIFFGFAVLTSSETSSADLILYFVVGHALKSVACLAIIFSIARREYPVIADKQAFFRYLFSSGVIGLGHSAIQRMPPLIISGFLPPMMRVSALSGWVLLDRAQTIQQSINLWLFQKNASEGISHKGMIKLILATAVIAFCLPVALSIVIAIATNFGIRSEYRDAPIAILLMAPAFMSVSLRNSLQSIAMSDGKNRMVLINVAVTAGLMGVLFLFHGAGVPLILAWITAALALGAFGYIVVQLRRERNRS